MNPFREKKIYFCALAVTLAYFCCLFYINLKQAKFDEIVSRHGFNTTLVLFVSNETAEVYGDKAKKLIAAGPRIRDGALALLSRDALNELESFPEVADVMAISRSLWQINTGNLKGDVEVLNVPPDFLKKFKLASMGSLKSDDYLPSPALAVKMGLNEDISTAVISVPDEMISVLPADMRNNFDWSNARIPINLNTRRFNWQPGLKGFDNILFTTGAEQRISVPGLFLLPKVNVVLRFRAGSDMIEVNKKIKSFLGNAKFSDSNIEVDVIPFSQYFAEELGIDIILDWAHRIRLSFIAMTLMLVVMIVLVRFGRIRYEIALRRALGMTSGRSVWLSTKFTILFIIAGAISGSIIASAFDLVVFSMHIPISLSDFAAVGGVASLAVMVVVGSARCCAMADMHLVLRSRS